MKTLSALAVLAGMSMVSNLLADEVKTVGGSNGYGPYQTGVGGEFTLQVVNGSDFLTGYMSHYAATTKNQVGNVVSFQTFCVEGTEYIYAGEQDTAIRSTVTLNSQVPLTAGAAFLYYQFATGILPGYNYGTDRSVTAGLLQNAIWAYMGQESFNVGNSQGNIFVKYAQGALTPAVANAANAGLYPVAVLSLWHDGMPRQDQLVVTPDGGLTIAFLGMAMSGLAFFRRKVA